MINMIYSSQSPIAQTQPCHEEYVTTWLQGWNMINIIDYEYDAVCFVGLYPPDAGSPLLRFRIFDEYQPSTVCWPTRYAIVDR